MKSAINASIIEDNDLEVPNIDRLPEIRRIQLLAERAKIETTARNEWWLPDIGVFASYTGFTVEKRNEFRSLPERNLSFGIRLSIDLENKRGLDSEMNARRSEVKSLSLQKEQLTAEVSHKIHEHQREMEKLLKQLRSEFERGIRGGEEKAPRKYFELFSCTCWSGDYDHDQDALIHKTDPIRCEHGVELARELDFLSQKETLRYCGLKPIIRIGASHVEMF